MQEVSGGIAIESLGQTSKSTDKILIRY